MDPRLIALVAAAAAGQPVPSITLICGPWIVQGYPVGDDALLYESAQRLDQLAANQVSGADLRQLRKDPTLQDELRVQIQANTAAVMGSLGQHAETHAALNLVRASAYSQVGTVTVPVIRVPPSAISAWWVTDFNHEPMKISGGGVGISF